jgi:ATP phosphoribosyltransferase regulatory subunit
LRAAGLERFTIDVGDAGVVRALLAPLPPERQAVLSEALARKDDAAIEDDTLRSLLDYCGDRDVLAEGVEFLARTPAAAAAARLLALFDAAVARGLGPHLIADLGEVRGFAYYTATIFHAYAPGTGDAVISGGRYDELLARFGCDLPAAGFALDLDRAAEAQRAAAVQDEPETRVVVVAGGGTDSPFVSELRARGIAAVTLADWASALAWARAWGFTHVVEVPPGTPERWVDAKSGASIASPIRTEQTAAQAGEAPSKVTPSEHRR